MAKINFVLQVQHFSDHPNVSADNGQTQLTVYGQISGTPHFRVYAESGIPGNWEPMSSSSGIGYKNVTFLSPGQYQLQYKDDAGERQLAKFAVFSLDQISCLNLFNNFLWVVISVKPAANPAVPLQVIGYGSASDGPGQAAVNAGTFKSFATGSGAEWTSVELDALGVVTEIDDIRFQIPGRCQLVLAEDLHFGEPSVPSDVEASFVKTDCTASGSNDGTITLSVSGGSGNYTFQWDDGPTTQNRTNLLPGFYSVTITDTGTGQVVVISNIQITAPAPVSEDVTEELTVQVRRPSCDKSKVVYLCWLNSLGGWDQWLFEDKNNAFENDVTTRTNEEFSRYVEKLDDVQSVTDYLSRNVRRSMRIGTGKLSMAQMAGFSELFSSAKVLMLTSEPDVRPPQWMGVRVKDGSFRYNEQTQEAEVTIELPDLIIQTN